MYKVITVIIASLFIVGSAAAAYKAEPLTDAQKAEVRARAAKLIAERDARAMHTNMNSMHKPARKAKRHGSAVHHPSQQHHKATKAD